MLLFVFRASAPAAADLSTETEESELFETAPEGNFLFLQFYIVVWNC